ncbi:MAG: dihydroorotate dehydrogenase, partial [Candidatus Margulisiibacteriota bacterium]
MVKPVDLTVRLGRLVLQNPIVTASGTFGNAVEFEQFMNLDKLGAVTLKSVTLKPKVGNAPPRVSETPCGMLNSIGLENKGLDHMIQFVLPELESLKRVKVIVNIAGHSTEENRICAKRLDKESRVDAIELNISCPNVEAGGLAFCQDLAGVKNLVKAVRTVT